MGRAFIGIGSNIEPEKNILMALRQLADSARLIAISRFYREPAIGRPNDPAFYNGVVSIETDLPPARLKEDVLRKIEAVLGRRRSSDKYAPRTIDLDLLLYNDYVDPDILERAFVAIPLSELDPDLVLPGSGLPIRQIANRFAAEEIEPLPEYTRLLRHQLLEGGLIMPEHLYSYIIVGGGLAGAAAVDGIRQHDTSGSILLLSAEPDIPYDRPPLTKQLWTGAKKVDQIFVHPQSFYAQHGVELKLATDVTQMDVQQHSIQDSTGTTFQYKKLLLATGGTPRRLQIPGGDLEGISYYRTLRDYQQLRAAASAGKSVVVIGGGFIGSEIAASLSMNGLTVTMIFPEDRLVSRIFPEPLGKALTDYYRSKGIVVLTYDVPTTIAKTGNGYVVNTRADEEIDADLVVVGVGITPNIALAQAAGLQTANGVVVDEFLKTSDPDVYAAGDIAFFPEQVLGPRRIEHWDNAISQGKHAGRNMAGANEPFTELPYFFSDLFEFGYEAVGQIDSRLPTFADWQEMYKTGVIYYVKDGRVRGAMMCNVWGKVDAARELIRRQQPVQMEDLRNAI